MAQRHDLRRENAPRTGLQPARRCGRGGSLALALAFACLLALGFALETGKAGARAVAFDPESGVGFVSRKDMIAILRVAPKQGLSFAYSRSVVLVQECSRQSGQSVVEYRSHKQTLSLEEPLEHEVRLYRRGKVAGYDLLGYAAPLQPLPELPQDICPNPNDNDAFDKWVPTGPVRIGGVDGGRLLVSYKGITKPLLVAP